MPPDNVVWFEVPIIVWLVVGMVFMIVTVARYGWGFGSTVLAKYRWIAGVTFVLAVIAAIALHMASGQPMPTYF